MSKRFITGGLVATFALAATACGGGDADVDTEADTIAADTVAAAPAPAPAAGPAGGALTTPSWMTVDANAMTVTLNIVAGETEANNRWNYNGYANGETTIVVPRGYTVTINFSNEDPANVHSAVVMAAQSTYPVTFETANPVFEGAATSNPTSMTEATASGASETISFTVDTAGEYALVCTIPAHAATGMWIGFQVSAEGESGVRM